MSVYIFCVFSFVLTFISGGKCAFKTNRCSCCLRANNPCDCPKLWFKKYPDRCGVGITNASRGLLNQPVVFVEAAYELDDGFYTLFVLDMDGLSPGKTWSNGYLVFAAANIEAECLKLQTGCRPMPTVEPQFLPCHGNVARYGPLRLILFKQSKIYNGSSSIISSDRTIRYEHLYNSDYLRLPPVRMNEYTAQYCKDSGSHILQLSTKRQERYQFGCSYMKNHRDRITSTFLQHFPIIPVLQANVTFELNRCHIYEDWLSKPLRPRSESKEFRKKCPFDTVTWARNVAKGKNGTEFLAFLRNRADDWFGLTQIEMMHLEKIMNSSSMFEPVQNEDGGAPPDIHAYFCPAFVRQFKKCVRVAARGEAYSQILWILGEKWSPNLEMYRTD
ncbi:hypothetical protein T265_09551 [Opisthorchis viverrini]|uniref:Uncharacterized protein n=1 Tax=Opisthorchis viverrini TaxID=6198 RepID=A0A074Z5I0_OPIVI|nr:hypothetical protein T265_09551 [Opisthorchis viverrini]KER22333.1 hypothetical protein T265_09551 [Opisthorchis viverrini]